LPSLTPGPAWLELRAARIRTTKGQETLPAGRLEVVYFAPPVGNPFEVVVRAAPLRREVVSTTLSVAELKKIPGGQNDPIKAVQNLPGVARAPFGAGQIVVWGSAPGDTRVYADGVQIPRVYHFGGVRSTISAEFVTDVRFRPGAYNADYGRGLGGVIEVTTRRPKSDRWHGSATLDLIDGNVTVEGPITKRLHVAAGGRVSWISALLPLFNTGGRSCRRSTGTIRRRCTTRRATRTIWICWCLGRRATSPPRWTIPTPTAASTSIASRTSGGARLRWTRRISPSTVFWITPSLGGDTFKVDTGTEGLGGQRINLTVMQLGYNVRAELRQKWGRLFDYALGLDFEGTRARVETIMPLSQGAADSQNIPVGGGDMVKDAGRSENGFFGDGLFSSSSGPSLRELLIYHLLQTSPYLITRFHLADDRIEDLAAAAGVARLPAAAESQRGQ
jgi:hypothetical protein